MILYSVALIFLKNVTEFAIDRFLSNFIFLKQPQLLAQLQM